MAAEPIPETRQRGRPRSRSTERAILKAASHFITSSGLAGMTIEGVAERAGVGKASIYRRWPSKGALAFDAAVDAILTAQRTPDTGNFESDLREVAENWVRGSNNPRGGRTVAYLIGELQSDPDLAAVWPERFVKRLRKERMPIIDRAVARGEIPAGSDRDLIMDLLYGPLYHRYLNRHLPLDAAFAGAVARMVAAAAKAGAAVPAEIAERI
jgi:AcrR family transcriptional regulator